MDTYFRKVPPIPTNLYLQQELMEDVEIRKQVAQHCQFATVVNVLANDKVETVRAAARKSDYWILVGKFQDILGFGKQERLKFARNEGQVNILVLLMHEDDLEVVREVLANPFITVEILAVFMRFLRERGGGKKDEQILEMANQALQVKRERIIKIATVKKAFRDLKKTENIYTILNYIADEDRTICKSIINILNEEEPDTLKKIIYSSLESDKFDSPLTQYIVITELIHLVHRRGDLKHVTIASMKVPEKAARKGSFQSIASFFLQVLLKKQKLIVQNSADDLTDFDNIILLSYCHVNNSSELRGLAANILSIDDIFNLVNDVSTPRKVFNQVLSILDEHPDELVIERVNTAHLRETNRLKENLTELEISVEAYFDIIFQSLGYTQINEYKDAIKTIASANKQIQRFKNVLLENISVKEQELNSIIDGITSVLKDKAHDIYFDTSQKIFRELEYIQSLIEEIFSLKDMGLESLRKGTPEDIETEIRMKGRIIWQSAISTYLGRIKDLAEMVKKKIIKIALEQENIQSISEDVSLAIEELEKAYKTKINCQLTIPCVNCNKRGCAAERFLTESEFFVSEILENFQIDDSNSL
jgi:hypothetical protein